MKTLSEYRKDHGLSQARLAESLRKMGIMISPTSIAMYEIGQRTPPLKKAQAIAQFFGVLTDDIFFGPSAHRKGASVTTGTEG